MVCVLCSEKISIDKQHRPFMIIIDHLCSCIELFILLSLSTIISSVFLHFLYRCFFPHPLFSPHSANHSGLGYATAATEADIVADIDNSNNDIDDPMV